MKLTVEAVAPANRDEAIVLLCAARDFLRNQVGAAEFSTVYTEWDVNQMERSIGKINDAMRDIVAVHEAKKAA